MVEQVLAKQPRNHILAGMSGADLSLIQPYLEPVVLRFRQRIESANRTIRNVYFVDQGIVSVVAVGGHDRRDAEVAIIGPEGMTGLPLILGVDRSPNETFVQIAGDGQTISAESLRRAMSESVTINTMFLRYAYVFSVQAAHTALANALGKIEERLARWLLMAHDRVDDDNLPVTHEFLATMLGVRRAGVTIALHQLESDGLVAIDRCAIAVLDRAGLEAAAGGLYGTPEAELRRLLPPPEN